MTLPGEAPEYPDQVAKAADYGVVEAFSGPGGMSLGLEEAGFRILFAFDKDAQAVETHRANIGGECVVMNAQDARGSDILRLLGLKKGELALFAGGPPCQGFSKQKRGAHLGDERNHLVLEYARLVGELAPRFLLFENVAIFGQKRGAAYLKEIREVLGSQYVFVSNFYNSADYGLAQTRERFVIVGRRVDQGGAFKIPAPNVWNWRTVGEVIGNLPDPPEDYTEHPQYPNHQRARVTKINIERFSHVPQGGGWQDIPRHLRLPCHLKVDATRGGWPDVYGRLRWDGQCPTITGGFDSFTRGRYGHPKSDRPLTPREAARLQGFPDRFVFRGNRGQVRSQIGNAVPPPLAEVLGREILRALRQHDRFMASGALSAAA